MAASKTTSDSTDPSPPRTSRYGELYTIRGYKEDGRRLAETFEGVEQILIHCRYTGLRALTSVTGHRLMFDDLNWVNSHGIDFARNSNVFLLAKWIDEGPALSYLTRACPTTGYALCAHLDELKGLAHDRSRK